MKLTPVKINYRTTRTAELWSDEEDIAWLAFFPDAELEEEDAVEVVRCAAETFVGERYVVLADIRNIKSVSTEARQYFAGKQTGDLHDALAILVNSTATRLLANFFINFHKPARPTRIFTDERKAVEWLKQYLPKK